MKSNKQDFNFQNMVDMWTKFKIKKMKQRIHIALKKSQRFGQKLSDHDWKEKAHRAQDAFYANLALSHHAPAQMSHQNLVEIGKHIFKKTNAIEMNKILRTGYINCNGEFFELADQSAQTKIFKSLERKTYTALHDHQDLEIKDDRPQFERVINNKKIA